jgi:four helix bundle protein
MRTDFTNNAIVQHCLQFSLAIISFVEKLEQERRFIIANQLLRSGTSIGAIVLEAQSAESKADFIHKMKIADKEGLETWYWLYLCKHAENYPFDERLQLKLDEILRILNAILGHRGRRKSN